MTLKTEKGKNRQAFCQNILELDLYSADSNTVSQTGCIRELIIKDGKRMAQSQWKKETHIVMY